ncbi:hypothetical protein HPY31_12150 [Brevibacillus sp. HB1.3]|uniref:hypothetical protein n=1 Tax=Brevibacillus sp. HB1.3 TaxID=2738842 RepID=UPI0015522758|nr:hypothetical protein [Brevibacillus sp. HB1.3]NQF14663.1 hypothetical protein [Brevibacillus sp. HB1.3]
MKKLLTIVSMVAVIAGVGSALLYKEFNQSNSHSLALSRTFKSTEEIVEKANVIIKGKVPTEFRQEKVGSVVYNVYEVQVDKLYSNLSDAKITEGESIEVYHLIALDLGDNKELANIVDADFHEIDNGEYLLFLSGEYDDELKKYTYIPNTPNQLFKMTSSKGLRENPSNIEFENVTEENALPSINEADLLEAIESKK